MSRRPPYVTLLLALALLVVSACRPAPTTAPPTPAPSPTVGPPPTEAQAPTETPASAAATGDEPYRISGTIEVTNPFIQYDNAEPFVLLEDESGFVARNLEYQFPLVSQVLGPITIHDDGSWTYELSLPARPQAALVDVDNNGRADEGVQVFAVAYWLNIWGDPFLEKREGSGWSTAYSSANVDSERNDEIVGGKLLVWAPDDKQAFPTGFGDDGLLFTKDDPAAPIAAGYSVVDLDASPFAFTKEAEPEVKLLEGSTALHDLSKLSYTEAFEQMWKTVSVEYPFTELKHLDWQQIHDETAPRVAEAEKKKDPVAFYLALRDFTWLIPDGHVGVDGDDGGLFNKGTAGGLGLAIRELDDGKVIATLVLDGGPAANAGIKVGATILEFDRKPIAEAVEQVRPWSAPFSTEHVRRLQQLRYLLRSEAGAGVEIRFQNRGQAARTAKLVSIEERDSFRATSFFAGQDPIALPVEARILDSGLGYIKVNDLLTDSNLIVRLWEHAVSQFVQNDVPGVIIDLRVNGGGSGLLAEMLPGYFVDEEVVLAQEYYYSSASGKFEPRGLPGRIEPASLQYKGPVAVLVGPACSSACEGMAYNFQVTGRAKIVGQYPSGGLFGEVGAGQYRLPEGVTLQVPTGRPVASDGSIVIENVGVVPDVKVPVDETTIFATDDVVLKAAEQALLGQS